jgi:hypothetical protein
MTAGDRFVRSLAIARAMGDESVQPSILNGIGALAVEQGRLDVAMRLSLNGLD